MQDRVGAVKQMSVFSVVCVASVILAGGVAYLSKPLGTAFVILWMLWGIVLALGRRSGSTSIHEARQRPILVISGTLSFSAIILAPWEHMNYGGPLPREGPFPWIGILIFVLAIGLQWWALRELGPLYTSRLGIQEGHRLVTSGPYGLVRHPGYLSGILAITGIALSMGSLLASVASIGSLLLVIWRIVGEEEMLLEAFGDFYRDYQRKTWKLIPLIY
jgi:protein-S-isoprenylcysteine O-methyltransferase Ste14